MEKLELAEVSNFMFFSIRDFEKSALKIAEEVVGQPGLYVVGENDKNLPPEVYESKQYETMISGGNLCKTKYTHTTICKPNDKICQQIVKFLKDLESSE